MFRIYSWCKIFVLIPVLLILGGTNQPYKRDLSDRFLSGKISLTLDKGIWKLPGEKIEYQSITLDLMCEQGKCSSEIWGYAPRFNRDVDHQGTVKISKEESAWQLEVNLNVQSHPGNPELVPATYTVKVVPHNDSLLGSYKGEYKGRTLLGKVTGSKSDLPFTRIENHQAIVFQEHPRLIFRASELPLLRQKAQTPHGQAIVNKLKQSLQQKIQYDGYIPTGGYYAAGHCFLSLLENDSNAAQTGWEITRKAMLNPGKRLLEHSPVVAGVALAYDLCYHQWNEAQQQQVTEWLTNQALKLIKGDSPKNGWNSYSWSNWNARARGAAGLAALAVLNEPPIYYPQNKFFKQPEDAEKLLKIAERNIARYLETAIGDRGLGTEGDHYTTEPWRLTILPFLQGYRKVKGIDLVPSKTQWFLPHYISRSVLIEGKPTIASYGRHRLSPPPSLYGIGLPLVSEQFLPAVLWFLERYQDNSSYGISQDLPISAIYALQGYPQQLEIANPEQIWHKVLVDRQKGFYSFRNQWQDSSDIVASIYAKKELLRASWAFPDAGSFRIAGLGHQWAIAGKSEAKPQHENIVVTAKSSQESAKTSYFQPQNDGSGIISLQQQNWLRSFAVDYSNASGSPGLFAIIDQFTIKETADFEPKIWTMHVTGKVSIQDQSFVIQSPNGATMQGTFISPQDVQLSYSSDKDGHKIQAQGINDFFVVMTIQRGSAAPIQVQGSGLDARVNIGKQTISFDGSKIVLDR